MYKIASLLDTFSGLIGLYLLSLNKDNIKMYTLGDHIGDVVKYRLRFGRLRPIVRQAVHVVQFT